MSGDQETTPIAGLLLGTLAMTAIVTASNILIAYPINDWLTWAAFSYPVAFLVTDLTNRALGPAAARKVVYAGFVVAVGLSLWLAEPRIALASGTAFLTAQLLDVTIFDRLRRASWWRAPFISSTLSSTVDTAIFFTLAFAGSGLPWMTWALGDYAVKLAMAIAMLVPFRALMEIIRAQAAAERA